MENYSFLSKGLKTFTISHLTAQEIEEAKQILTTSFCQREALAAHLRIPEDIFSVFVERFLIRAASEKLGFICREKATSRMAAVVIFWDYFSMRKNPILGSDLGELISEICEFLESLGTCNTIGVNNFYEMLDLFMIGTHNDFLQQGIAKEIAKFCLEKDPLVSKAKLITIECTGPYSTKIFSDLKCETMKVIHPKDYVNAKGKLPFANINETAEKIGIHNYKGVTLMKKEQNVHLL